MLYPAQPTKQRRVVVTGLGILSCIGTNKTQVIEALKTSHSGITLDPVMQEMNFRSQVSGRIDLNLESHIDRKLKRFMGDSGAYAYLALQDAIQDANLSAGLISHSRTGLISGSGGSSAANHVEAADIARKSGIKKMGPYRVARTMTNSVSAALAVAAKIKGVSYTIASACATSSHAIGHSANLIRSGMQDIMFAGGGEEHHWALAGMFDAMGVLSSKYNDSPKEASRPFDTGRDGFAISCGGGMLVLESLEHALNRGAMIYAEITGYGATTDGEDMVAPNSDGAVRCMQQALATHQDSIGYINAHATSTPHGDTSELKAIQRVFSEGGKHIPPISSTKSISGHSLGATGVHEAIYSLLMMQERFLAGSANITHPDALASTLPILKETQFDTKIDAFLTNSFGFGGTNSSLIFKKHQ